jgi:hypothetical protein
VARELTDEEAEAKRPGRFASMKLPTGREVRFEAAWTERIRNEEKFAVGDLVTVEDNELVVVSVAPAELGSFVGKAKPETVRLAEPTPAD